MVVLHTLLLGPSTFHTKYSTPHHTPLLTISVYFSQIHQIPTHKAILQKAKALLLCKLLFPFLSFPFPCFPSPLVPFFLVFPPYPHPPYHSLPYLFATSPFFFSSTGFLLPIILFPSCNRSHQSPSPHFRVLAFRSETVRQELFGFLCTTFEASENCLT